MSSDREQSSDASRQAILEAAAACFMERGYEAASIDEVARRLGATKGRVYHHFPAKADLLAGVFRAGMEMNFQAVAAARAVSGPAVHRWNAMAAAHVRQIITTRSFQRAVWQGVEMHLRGATTPTQRDTFAELVAMRDDYSGIFRQAIEQARTEGDMRFADAGIANQVMFMALNSPLFWYTPRPGETAADLDAIVRQVVGFALGGLGGDTTLLDQDENEGG